MVINLSKNEYSLNKDIFGFYEMAYNCLKDKERTDFFRKAIHQTVKRGDIVMDVGAGTGILSLFALEKKPKKIYAIEITKFLAEIAEKNFDQNKASNIITTINIDGAFLEKLKDEINLKPDVIIMELMSTGLVEEMQIQVFNSLIKNKILKKDSLMIPSGYKTYAHLSQVDYEGYGFNLKMIQHEQKWQKSNILKHLSKKQDIKNINFNESIKLLKQIDNKINKEIIFKIERGGIVNGLVISGETELSDTVILKQSFLLNNPVIMPLDDLKVKTGDIIKIRLAYGMGEGLEKVKVKYN